MDRDYRIDVARTISMLWIVGFWHLIEYTNDFPRYNNYINKSFTLAALGTFTFLSAYLICSKYSFDTVRDYKGFIANRFVRIYPLFLLSTLGLLAGGSVSTGTAVKALLGLSSFSPTQPPTIWYISMLIDFYAVTPLLMAGRISLKILMLLTVSIFLYCLHGYVHHIDIRLVTYFPCFFMGAIFGKHYNISHLVSTWSHRILCILSFVGVTILLRALKIDSPLLTVLPAFAGTLMVLAISQVLVEFKVILRIAKVLSYGSLCAYLFHRHIYVITDVRHILKTDINES